MSSAPEIERGSPLATTAEFDEWGVPQQPVYSVLAVLGDPEPEGIPAYTPSLPGVSAFGSTEDEAIENLKDAVRVAIESYEDSSEEVPWVRFQVEPATDGEAVWIEVDA